MRPFPRAERASAAALAVGLFVAGVRPASAQAGPPPDPDEVVDLRVGKDAAGRVALEWQPPATAVDTYQVRRCVLPSLRVPYYGNCVAEGLAVTAWDEPVPEGNVFYLVSGSIAGVEGSLGRSFDGTSWTSRTAPACSSPFPPAPLSIEIVLDEAMEVCGSDIIVRYPADGATFRTAACVGIMSGGFGATNDTIPGEVRQACVLFGSTLGPGVLTRMDFDVGACPLRLDAFELVECLVLPGPNCGSTSAIPLPCRVQ